MIDIKLQLFMLIAIVFYFCVLIGLLKKNRISLKYTLLWILSGCLMLLLAIFPQVLEWFSLLIGIQIPANALFAILFFCVLIILISLTAIVSKLSDNVKTLAQDIALLEHRIRELTENDA